MDVIVNTKCCIPSFQSQLQKKASSYYVELLYALGYSKEAVPVGDLLRRYHGLSGTWVVVSPIFWQASHNDVCLAAFDEDLQWSLEEAQYWFTILKTFLSEEHIQLYYHSPYLWLLRCDHRGPIIAPPVYELAQKSLSLALKNLDTELFWQRFLTEVQMLFAAAMKPNIESCGITPNGIWVWGYGTLDEVAQRPLFVCDTAALQLAQCISNTATMYVKERRYPKDSIFLCSELSTETPLISKLSKKHTLWHWNDGSNACKAKAWWKRFLYWS